MADVKICIDISAPTEFAIYNLITLFLREIYLHILAIRRGKNARYFQLLAYVRSLCKAKLFTRTVQLALNFNINCTFRKCFIAFNYLTILSMTNLIYETP